MKISSIITTSALFAGAIVALNACSQSQPKTISMRSSGGVADATVVVDDQFLGNLAYVNAHGVALPPGRHRMSVERPGYFPFDVVIDVKEGDPAVQVAVEMKKIPQ